MTRSCGGVAGGLTRVAYLDMTDSSEVCYDTLRERTVSGIRACTPLEDTATCSSVQHQSPISYSKVCGLIHANYGKSLDGFNGGGIDDIYVEGVSLTHGSPTRNHIWSFAGKRCGSSSCGTAPAFVGSDYFCDGANYGSYNVRMWDGVCDHSGCYDCDTDPWFIKSLPQSTSDDIEMRSDVG